MFDDVVAATMGTRGVGAVQAWARVESAACARRLAAMASMLDAAYAADGSTERDQWFLDDWAAVCAHIGAAARITSGAASGLLLIATALRDRFPKLAALFAAGVIDYPMVRAIVSRAACVADPDARRSLDDALAEALPWWEPMSVDRTTAAIDALIGEIDPDAVRRTQTRARGRSVEVDVEDGSGLGTLFATLFAHDAVAVDTRMNAFADTVCPADPRTRDQRRSDALGAMARGQDRLGCLCGSEDCAVASTPPSTGVVVYVVAPHHTITDTPPDGPRNPDGPDGPDGPDAPDAPDPSDGAGSDESVGGTDVFEHSATGEEAAVESVANTSPAAGPGAVEAAALDGAEPPLFDRPLRQMTTAEVLAYRDPGRLAALAPAATIGGAFLPGAVARRAALGATIVPIVHPGVAPPEARYTPSAKLAAFVRCRDLTCRFPGCREPATGCDFDHTVPWPYGPTQAANLKCLCRRHHLLKTFWGGEQGWRDRQLPDGTVIWTAPDGGTHVTTPGSRLLLPSLCAATAAAVATTPPPAHTAGLTMPRRRYTRIQNRARRIHRERQLNQAHAAGTARDDPIDF